jgi:large subunit ribosomal protein L33
MRPVLQHVSVRAASERFVEAVVAKKKNVARTVITLECTEQRESGVPGMSRYTTQKNKKNTPKRLELKKYNPYLKRQTLHREVK